MEKWREVWRNGFGKVLPTKGLEALLAALESNSPDLIQNATCAPAPLACFTDYGVNACCGVAYTGWKGDVLETQTVGEVEAFFAEKCFLVDDQLFNDLVNGPCRHFLNWFDDTPRNTMSIELIPEVKRTLQEREQQESDYAEHDSLPR